MRLLIAFLLILNSFVQSKGQNSEMTFLLDSIIVIDKDNFQLSGMSIYNKSLYVVGDRPKMVYQITDKDNKLTPVFDGISQMEAIVFVENSKVYISSEEKNEIYVFPEGKVLLNANQLNTSDWKEAGIEGIAFDTKSNVLYFAKERSNAAIHSYNLDTEVLETFQTKGIRRFEDISDLYLKGNSLYVLERKARNIRKLDLETMDPVSDFNFRKYVISPQNQDHLYQHGEKEGFGLAEALIITEEYIYIGFDNNNSRIHSWVEKTYNIKGIGRNSIIMMFKKPKGF